MSLKKQLKASIESEEQKAFVSEFLLWAKEHRGIKPALASAVIMQWGVQNFLFDSVNAPNEDNITNFSYYADTTAFYEKHKKHILTWLLTEAESLSDVYDSAIAMVADLRLMKVNEVSHDETAMYMWRSNKKNRNDDMGVYEAYANEVCKLIARRVSEAYYDFYQEKNN